MSKNKKEQTLQKPERKGIQTKDQALLSEIGSEGTRTTNRKWGVRGSGASGEGVDQYHSLSTSGSSVTTDGLNPYGWNLWYHPSVIQTALHITHVFQVHHCKIWSRSQKVYPERKPRIPTLWQFLQLKWVIFWTDTFATHDTNDQQFGVPFNSKISCQCIPIECLKYRRLRSFRWNDNTNSILPIYPYIRAVLWVNASEVRYIVSILFSRL